MGLSFTECITSGVWSTRVTGDMVLPLNRSGEARSARSSHDICLARARTRLSQECSEKDSLYKFVIVERAEQNRKHPSS